jgi:Holliday junction resolvase RusA-like endonuclease
MRATPHSQKIQGMNRSADGRVETTIVISGAPVPQHRPRFARHSRGVTTYSDQHSEAELFRYHAIVQHGPRPLDGPLMVTMRFSLPRPKSHYLKLANGRMALKGSAPKYPTGRPDLSNLIKFVEDAWNGIVWHDDAQIVAINATMDWTTGDGQTVVTVEGAVF